MKAHREAVSYNEINEKTPIEILKNPEKLLKLVQNAIIYCPKTLPYIDPNGEVPKKSCETVHEILDYLYNPEFIKDPATNTNVKDRIPRIYTHCLNGDVCGDAQTMLKALESDIKALIPSASEQGTDSFPPYVMDLSEIEPQIPEIDPSKKDLDLRNPDIPEPISSVYDEVIDKQSGIIDNQNERMDNLFKIIERQSEMLNAVLSNATQVPNQHADSTVEPITVSVPPEDHSLPYYHQ